MELLKKERAELKIADVCLFVRTRATIADKLALERIESRGAARLRAGDGSAEVLAWMGEQMARLFVDGWSGVTVDGQAVPYSFDRLMDGFPAAMAAELIPKLSQFIAENVDVLKSKS